MFYKVVFVPADNKDVKLTSVGVRLLDDSLRVVTKDGQNVDIKKDDSFFTVVSVDPIEGLV